MFNWIKDKWGKFKRRIILFFIGGTVLAMGVILLPGGLPSNVYVSPTGVTYEIVEVGEKNGSPYYSVEFWGSESDYQNLPPYLLNDFIMQIRTEHQRMKTTPDGKYIHSSGAEVVDMQIFREEDPRFIRYERDKGKIKTNPSGEWMKKGGGAVLPFEYRYGSDVEYLDPQWERELYSIPLIDSAKQNIENYIERAIKNDWEGDRRGTTLNLQIGHADDDAYERRNGSAAVLNDDFVQVKNDTTATAIRDAIFRFVTDSSELQNATGITATLTVDVFNAGKDDIDADIFMEDVATSARPLAADGNVSDRTPTTATINADIDNVGLGPEVLVDVVSGDGPDASVQEIADRGDNTVISVLMFPDGTAADRDMSITSYDVNSASSTKLDIDYTAAPAVGGAATSTSQSFWW